MKRARSNLPPMALPFYLTQIGDEKDPISVTINDIIFDTESNQLQHACLMNYMVDPEWLFSTCPCLLRAPVLLIHGHKGLPPIDLPNVVSSMVDLGQESYGTHHTKMMILTYPTGLRLAIGTSNLLEGDWIAKTQGWWIQDFPLKSHNREQTFVGGGCKSNGGDSSVKELTIPHFETDLREYLSEVRLNSARAQIMLSSRLMSKLSLYDFSGAQVVLVGSVPGRHPTAGVNDHKWGHLKLQRTLRTYDSDVIESTNARASDINREKVVTVVQCSSIGSLGRNDFFANELASSMGCNLGDPFHLVWPTVDTVRQSVEGWAAGSSIPCDSKHMYSDSPSCQHLRPFFAQSLRLWDGTPSGRARAPPHIKTYFRYRITQIVQSSPTAYAGTHSTSTNPTGLSTTSKQGNNNFGTFSSILHLPHANSDRIHETIFNESNIDGILSKNSMSSNAQKKSEVIDLTNDGTDLVRLSELEPQCVLDWFLLTSSNFSQAAWGVLQKSGGSLYIKSYELGVLFLPALYSCASRRFSCTPDHLVLGICGHMSPNARSHAQRSGSEYLPVPLRNKFVPVTLEQLITHTGDPAWPIGFIPFPVPHTLEAPAYRNQDTPWVWDLPRNRPDGSGRTFPGIKFK